MAERGARRPRRAFRAWARARDIEPVRDNGLHLPANSRLEIDRQHRPDLDAETLGVGLHPLEVSMPHFIAPAAGYEQNRISSGTFQTRNRGRELRVHAFELNQTFARFDIHHQRRPQRLAQLASTRSNARVVLFTRASTRNFSGGNRLLPSFRSGTSNITLVRSSAAWVAPSKSINSPSDWREPTLSVRPSLSAFSIRSPRRSPRRRYCCGRSRSAVCR